jgi:hypothetical protein
MTQILYPLDFILQSVNEKTAAVLSSQRSPTPKEMLWKRFSHFARLSFSLEKHVNENEYEALVDRYWEGKPKYSENLSRCHFFHNSNPGLHGMYWIIWVMYKDSACTARQTHPVSVIECTQFMLFFFARSIKNTQIQVEKSGRLNQCTELH